MGASALNSEDVSSAIFFLVFNGGFERRCAWRFVLGPDDEDEGACSPLDYHH